VSKSGEKTQNLILIWREIKLQAIKKNWQSTSKFLLPEEEIVKMIKERMIMGLKSNRILDKI